jgi:hypothetical protein
MSDELIGLVRETLAETRSLRADVDATTRSVGDRGAACASIGAVLA